MFFFGSGFVFFLSKNFVRGVMKNKISILALFFLLLSACQKDPSRETTELESNFSTVPKLVQAADGTLYSASCLQENASQIQTQGQAAMNACKMVVKLNSSGSASVARGKFFYGNSWAAVYYPPTYWNTSSYSYPYGSSYNPYYDTSYNNNAFCSYIFGGNYNINCYYLFGYTSPSNYTNYYNPNCNYCLYSTSYTSCQKQCMNYNYYVTY